MIDFGLESEITDDKCRVEKRIEVGIRVLLCSCAKGGEDRQQTKNSNPFHGDDNVSTLLPSPWTA